MPSLVSIISDLVTVMVMLIWDFSQREIKISQPAIMDMLSTPLLTTKSIAKAMKFANYLSDTIIILADNQRHTITVSHVKSRN